MAVLGVCMVGGAQPVSASATVCHGRGSAPACVTLFYDNGSVSSYSSGGCETLIWEEWGWRGRGIMSGRTLEHHSSIDERTSSSPKASLPLGVPADQQGSSRHCIFSSDPACSDRAQARVSQGVEDGVVGREATGPLHTPAAQVPFLVTHVPLCLGICYFLPLPCTSPGTGSL